MTKFGCISVYAQMWGCVGGLSVDHTMLDGREARSLDDIAAGSVPSYLTVSLLSGRCSNGYEAKFHYEVQE